MIDVNSARDENIQNCPWSDFHVVCLLQQFQKILMIINFQKSGLTRKSMHHPLEKFASNERAVLKKQFKVKKLLFVVPRIAVEIPERNRKLMVYGQPHTPTATTWGDSFLF